MRLVGHEPQQHAFLDAWSAGRMHHAWLLAGPRGIGKRRFADLVSRFVLAGGKGADGLAIPDEAQAARLLNAGSHPDFRLLERGENDRGKLRAEIVVDQMRSLRPLVEGKPTLSEWRVVLVDAACEMNRSAANAFLKNLEEPPEKTLFLLVCHSPGRLLPTIRSRCRTLAFRPLGDVAVGEVLRAELEESADIEALTGIAGGAPGRALRFAGLDIGQLTAELEALAAAPAREADRRALALARTLSAKTAQPRYEAFVELVPAFLAEQAKRRQGASLAESIALWEKARELAAEALPLSLDPQSVVYALGKLVGRLQPQDRAA